MFGYGSVTVSFNFLKMAFLSAIGLFRGKYSRFVHYSFAWTKGLCFSFVTITNYCNFSQHIFLKFS